jgi:hypothetical protein
MLRPGPLVDQGDGRRRGPVYRIDGASLSATPDGALLFSEPAQKVVGLTDSAAAIVSHLIDGAMTAEIERRIEGVEAGEASAYVRQTLSIACDLGLLSADRTAEPPACLLQLLALPGLGVTLHYAEREIADLAAPIFAPFETSCDTPATQASGGPAMLRYDVWREDGFVFLQGSEGAAAVYRDDQAGPALKARLTDDVIAANPASLILHVATLERDGAALLLCGHPGAGKTTLALELLKDGFSFRGDDLALLRMDGTIDPLPFAPGIKPDGWPGQAPDAPTHRRLDGRAVRYRPVAAPPSHRPLRVRWIALLDRREVDGPSIADVEIPVVLRDLIGDGFTITRRLSARNYESLLGLLGGSRNVRLTFREAAEARRSIVDLCRDAP